MAQGRAEHLVPGLPHQLEQGRGVPGTDALVGEHLVVDEALHLGSRQGTGGHGALDFALDEWPETGLEQLQQLANPFVAGDSHGVLYGSLMSALT
jgi:hypothetical protein